MGASIGDFSIGVLNEFPSAKIFSFEPDPKSFSLLKENILLNNAEKHVKAFNFGIDSESKGRFKTLAQVFLENQIESCDLLKMDIEGYEYKIFELMDVKTLCLIKRITMECHFPANLDESKLQALINRLRSHGFIIEIKKILSNNTVVFLYGENQ